MPMELPPGSRSRTFLAPEVLSPQATLSLLPIIPEYRSSRYTGNNSCAKTVIAALTVTAKDQKQPT